MTKAKKLFQDDTNFLAWLASMTTTSYGLHLIVSTDYLLNKFTKLPHASFAENILGLLFILAALIKMFGLKYNHKPCKRLGLVLMIGLWAFTVAIYFTQIFSFDFLGLILTAPILIILLRIARRGDFIE